MHLRQCLVLKCFIEQFITITSSTIDMIMLIALLPSKTSLIACTVHSQHNILLQTAATQQDYYNNKKS